MLSTNENDCSVIVKPTVAADDLREMEDTFHEQLNSGLQMLAEKSGTGGLPKAPDTGTTSTDVPAPAAEVEVVDQLAALRVQADQAEYRAAQEAQSSGDLRAALALFQDLAEKAGPMRSRAQERADQVAELVADAKDSTGIIGNLTVQPPGGSEHNQGAAHSRLSTRGAGGKGREPAAGKGGRPYPRMTSVPNPTNQSQQRRQNCLLLHLNNTLVVLAAGFWLYRFCHFLMELKWIRSSRTGVYSSRDIIIPGLLT